MKNIKTFESWENNTIDNSLFSSGRAKYDPNVINGTIHYKTSNTQPHYFATITRKGERFICKIYKRKKSGEEIRLRNKIKPAIEQDDLKISHNYVREFLNQRLKKDKEKKGKGKEDVHKKMRQSFQRPEVENPEFFERPPQNKEEPIFPKRKSIIRRF